MIHPTVKVSEQVNRKCPSRNTILQLLTCYTDPKRLKSMSLMIIQKSYIKTCIKSRLPFETVNKKVTTGLFVWLAV